VQTDAVAGAILGCAVGDALGLPYEGLSGRRGARLLGAPDRHRFIFGRGMVSDDTEHTCMVAQALCEHPSEVDAFARALGRRLRWWLLGVPAGIGWATLRACVKLWLGFPVERSGVHAAGNGPAMRTAVLGAAIGDVDRLKQFVRASTLITHADPKAFQGALAVALAAWCAKRGIDTPRGFFEQYRAMVGMSPDATDDFAALMVKVEASVGAGASTLEFAKDIGCERGVSGYVLRTVPVALHTWLSHPRDYRPAVTEIIRCGGDTDTTAAIVGAIVGSGVGRAGIPMEWVEGWWEWPRSVAWMEQLARAVGDAVNAGQSVVSPKVVRSLGLARNAVFLTAVLIHAVRRMLPPY
jgi:ADP-ribosyl-[dinitrogen reductase] hydrolase